MSSHSLCLGLLFALTATVSLAAEPNRQGPLRPMSECFDPGRARSWHLIDSDEILVDAGRRHFHLQLRFACPELNYNHTVGFKSGSGVGRICGSSGDVIATARPGSRLARCAIATVTPLDEAAYKAWVNDKPQGVVETREPTQ